MDEQQDMTPILWRFAKKLLRDRSTRNNTNNQLNHITTKFSNQEVLPTNKHNKADNNTDKTASNKTIHDGVQFLLLGDPRQEIYTYNGANHRFLTMAQHVFSSSFSTRPWHTIRHVTTYRFGHPIADFVNKQIPGKPPHSHAIEVSPVILSNQVSNAHTYTCDSDTPTRRQACS